MHDLFLFAKVISTVDKEGLGRVQVQLLGYNDKVILPWLRLLSPYASNKAGAIFLPEVGDEVLVLRGALDDLDGMVILGALYNGGNKPGYSNADEKNITKQIRTRTGNELTWSDKDNETGITLKTKAGNELALFDKSDVSGITLKNSDGTVELRLNVEGARLEVTHTKPITLVTNGEATIDAQGSVTVKSMQGVTVEGQGGVTIESTATLTVKSSANVKIEAPAVQISAGTVSLG